MRNFVAFSPLSSFCFCAHTFCELILSLAPPSSWEVGAKELWEAGAGRGTVWAGCKGKAGWLQCCQDLCGCSMPLYPKRLLKKALVVVMLQISLPCILIYPTTPKIIPFPSLVQYSGHWNTTSKGIKAVVFRHGRDFTL